MPVLCQQSPVLAGSAALAALGLLVLYLAEPSGYGKHSETLMPAAIRLPARAAWFLQELPSFVVPAGILAGQPRSLFGPPATVLLGLFCAHYFHRGFAFCVGNGLLQSYYLVYCAEYPAEWYTDIRFSLGVFLFILGMGINIHSDYILRRLRKPGETTYRIPQGGLFTYVSGANFLGEIIEWIGYALATWSLPGLAFAFFSLCFLGQRAFHHHRFYLKMFEDYPKSRKALIPFIF
ncbi:3-oxo-5-alpha-steroid 4-dehydrogenase 2 isoform X2 [Camelus ferus]|uniref:3-oxo-5alpha-steroid 4-dehydrogenase (NADP(+)) n=2 Tax=Camelus TaxID=9836 RepID=A0A8B8UFS8_CAMFR|nr:3-oxo-5-alpha-steroid 4-dehydrogenase 2 isoform X2 [Camelus ferus]